MDITLQVFLKEEKEQKSQIFVADLFAVEPIKINDVRSCSLLADKINDFNIYVNEVLKNTNKIVLDQAHAKFQTCLDFNHNGIIKNHSISIPLTLFMLYSRADLFDISNHIFLELHDKWYKFYKQSIGE